MHKFDLLTFFIKQGEYGPTDYWPSGPMDEFMLGEGKLHWESNMLYTTIFTGLRCPLPFSYVMSVTVLVYFSTLFFMLSAKKCGRIILFLLIFVSIRFLAYLS